MALTAIILIPTIVLASIAIISTIFFLRNQNINNAFKSTTTAPTTESITNNFLFVGLCNCQIVPNCPYYKSKGIVLNLNHVQRCGFDSSTLSIQICCPASDNNAYIPNEPTEYPSKAISGQIPIPSTHHHKPVKSSPVVTVRTTSTTTTTTMKYNINVTVDEDYPIEDIDVRKTTTGEPINQIIDGQNTDKSTDKKVPKSPTPNDEDLEDYDADLISKFLQSVQLERNSFLNLHKNFKLLPQSTDECGRSKDLPLIDIKRKRRRKRVVGGRKVSLDTYPWIVRLFYNITGRCETEMCYGCLGTVLNHKYILTTAHCAHIPTDPMTIVAGNETITKTYTVEKIIAHPEYNNTTKHKDIALLRLRDSIIFAEVPIRPVCLPFFDAYNLKSVEELVNDTNNEVIVAGWGVTNKSDTTTWGKGLSEAVVPEWPSSKCQRVYNMYNRNKTVELHQFCTGDTERMADACWGDSGGGIYSLKSMLQVGIVSYGFPSPYECGGLPGVNTRIIFYLKWILDNIKP